MRSVYDAIKVVVAVDPSSVAGTGSPSAAFVNEVDTLGYNSALFEIAVGTVTGTTVSFTVDVEIWESGTTSGTFVLVSGATAQITGTATTASKHAQIRVEGLGTSRLRFLKAQVNSVTSPTDKVLPVAVIALLGRGFREPVGNSSTAALT